MRDLREAFERLAFASVGDLKFIASHDPDMIRSVARALALHSEPKFSAHDEHCQIVDTNEFGPCTCGIDAAWKKRFRLPL